ncbi:hypothetical protein DXG01_011517, partial [Tephrocybe rancida]
TLSLYLFLRRMDKTRSGAKAANLLILPHVAPRTGWLNWETQSSWGSTYERICETLEAEGMWDIGPSEVFLVESWRDVGKLD